MLGYICTQCIFHAKLNIDNENLLFQVEVGKFEPKSTINTHLERAKHHTGWYKIIRFFDNNLYTLGCYSVQVNSTVFFC